MDGWNRSAEEWNATTEKVTRNPYVQLVFQLRFWVYVFVIPFGLLGNLLSLLVVCRKQNRALSCSVYMGALAVADAAVLLCQAALLLANSKPNGLSHPVLSIICKIFSYMSYSAAFCGVLIILALLLERVIAVTRPLKAALWLSPTRAIIITFIITVIALIYNIPVYPTTSFTIQCVSTPGTSRLYTAYQMSKLFFSGLLPFLGILTMNIIILCVVKSGDKSKKQSSAQVQISNVSSTSSAMTITSADDSMVNIEIRDEFRNTQSPDTNAGKEARVNLGMTHNNQQRRREMQLTLMTVLMSCMFLCLTMPKYVHQLIFININWSGSADTIVTFGWSASITSQLLLFNSAINFYLYAMAGSKFRSDLVKVMRCR